MNITIPEWIVPILTCICGGIVSPAVILAILFWRFLKSQPGPNIEGVTYSNDPLGKLTKQ